jgi:hypothetical protein
MAEISKDPDTRKSPFGANVVLPDRTELTALTSSCFEFLSEGDLEKTLLFVVACTLKVTREQIGSAWIKAGISPMIMMEEPRILAC